METNFFSWANNASKRLYERGAEIFDLLLDAYGILVYVVEGRELDGN